MTNRKQRQTAISRGEPVKWLPTRSRLTTTHATGPYWHVTVQDSDRGKEEKNLALEAVLEESRFRHASIRHSGLTVSSSIRPGSNACVLPRRRRSSTSLN